MNKMKISIIVFSLLIIGCSSNVLDQNYNKDNSQNDIKELKKELTIKEFNSLTGIIMVMEIEGQNISSFTYKELLEKGLLFDEEYNNNK